MSEQNTHFDFSQIDYEAYATTGEVPFSIPEISDAVAEHQAMATEGVREIKPPLLSDDELAQYIVTRRRTWRAAEINSERDALLERIQYVPKSNPNLSPRLERIPFFEVVKDKVVTYAERHQDARNKKGKGESAEWGTAEISGHKVIVFPMNFDFIGGSLSVVAGELFREAAQAATEQKVPLVAIYMTGGARQHENSAALYQMPSLIKAINKFTDSNPDLPVVSVLLGQVWGGVTASSMPRGTVRIAYTGTRMGFAGSRVIKSSRGSTMSLEEIEAAQRAEAHAIKRNVDVLVEDSDELVDVIGGLIGRLKDHAKRDKHPFNEAVLQEQALRPELQKITGREIKVGDKPIISSLRWVRRTEKGTTYVVEPRGEDPTLSEEDRLYERYRNILHDASRPDADMFISYALRDPVQFYNRFVDPKGNIYYPRFIAAIGNIGLQPFLVLGHQASFIKNGDTYSKYPSIPNTNDFRYALRWLKKGMDFKLPLITITDTLGAEASIEAEHGGQFDQIAEFLDIYDRYPAPIISLIPGILGSGGGLTAGTRADAQAMTERALMMVAETRSAASIVYGENPTPKQERLTMLGLGPSSETQLINGLIDRVVPEYPSPYQTVMAMRNYVIETYGSLQSMRTLRRRREERDKNVQAFDTIVSTATIAVD